VTASRTQVRVCGSRMAPLACGCLVDVQGDLFSGYVETKLMYFVMHLGGVKHDGTYVKKSLYLFVVVV
jgi:hypothetical protein